MWDAFDEGQGLDYLKSELGKFERDTVFDQSMGDYILVPKSVIEQAGIALGGFVDTICVARKDGSARQGRILSRETIQQSLAAANGLRDLLTASPASDIPSDVGKIGKSP